MTTLGRRSIAGFDALRAFSVLLVIASHVGINGASPTWAAFFDVFNASYGVRTFFVLSGFLITTLLIKEHAVTGQISITQFMIRRALRILPLYFLILAIVAILTASGVAQSAGNAMLYGTFFGYNFIPHRDNVHYLSHLWSLAVEEQFYLLWPLLFAFLFAKKRALPWLCVAVIAVCWLRMETGYGDLAKSYSPGRWTLPAIYPIMVGCLAALTLNGAMRTLPALIGSVALISLPLWNPQTPFIDIAGTFGIAGLIAWIFTNQDRRVVHALDWGPIGYLGVISYGLYMWQGILTGNGPYRPVPGWPPDPLIGAVLTFIIAPISFHFFERPISDARKRFKAARRPIAEGVG